MDYHGAFVHIDRIVPAGTAEAAGYKNGKVIKGAEQALLLTGQLGSIAGIPCFSCAEVLLKPLDYIFG